MPNQSILFVFYSNALIDTCVCDNWEYAQACEMDLAKQVNDLELVTVYGKNEDECWKALDRVLPDQFRLF